MKAANPTTIPVTILTGYLGSGKTTLLNHILSENHGEKIAVIENEFGEAGIDNELLVQDRDEQIIEMNNGCICCTVRGDLVRILGDLAQRRADGTLKFDRAIIETTGLADPAPVAQTFFVDDDVVANYHLDAIVTMVDAKHANAQLDQHHEAQEQVGFADRILLSKTDLVSPEELLTLRTRLRTMNSHAPVEVAEFGHAAVDQLLDIRAFSLPQVLAFDPAFLSDVTHEHDDTIASFVFRSDRPFDPERIEAFMGIIIERFGVDLLRYKGVLSVEGADDRIIFQGVHMLFASTPGRRWNATEKRESVLVFIGRKLPREWFMGALDACLVETVPS